MPTCVGATRTEVAVVGGDDATESRVAEMMGAWAICDGVVPRRTINAPGHHEVAHGVGAGSRFVVVPRTGKPVMTFFSELEGVLYGEGLGDHSHLDGPISRMGDGRFGLENASVGISEVWVKAGARFCLDETFTYWSHPESPHKFVPVEPLLSLDEADLFLFVPSESVDVRY